MSRNVRILFSLVLMLVSATAAKTVFAGFVMVSAYKLAPFSTYYEDTVMDTLAQTDHSGIVYSTINAPYMSYNELNYNSQLYAKANQVNANIWMQMRIYDNGFGYNSRQLIQNNPYARNQFFTVFDPAIQQYANAFSGDCKIILFEEAGIYHQPWSGGDFWAGGNQNYNGTKLSVDTLWDKVFVYRFTKLFNILYNRIKSTTNCEVGFHMGHAAMYRSYGGKRVMEHIFDGITTDFILYDLYPMASPTYASFAAKLADRLPMLVQNTDVYYLNQMHTMNYFQNGGGRAPSGQIMRDSTELAYSLGVKDVGWYTKNAQPALNAPAFNPNANGQRTALESSPHRYYYGLGLTSR